MKSIEYDETCISLSISSIPAQALPYQRPPRACPQALPAPDTLRAVRLLPDRYIHFTHFLTLPAFCTLPLPHLITIQRNRVKQTVNCSKRADIFTERTVYPQGYDNHCCQKKYLPREQFTHCHAKCLIEKDKGDSRPQRSGRTDIFTEPGAPLPYNIRNKKRQQNNKYCQNYIFHPHKHLMSRKILTFPGKRYLIQEILHEPEGAKPPADKPPEQ